MTTSFWVQWGLVRRVRFFAWLVALAAFAFPLSARAATWYVAPTGSDTAAGTMAAPFASWGRAQTAAAAGDTVYFRGGTYALTTSTSTCAAQSASSPETATVDAIVLSKSGTAGAMINYWAFPGETPVFDFSGINDLTKYNCRHTGLRIEGDYLYLKGFELKGVLQLNNLNHESWCVYVIGGNNNIFELLNAHHNMGPGFFVQTGGNNTFLNDDSHENEDTLTSNGDGQSADGFGCHPNKAGDTGNIFHGCRAWWNSDDGWDFINSQEVCTVEYSWAWYAGYKPDAITNGAPVALTAGNGNGFKGGGYGDPQTGVPAVPPQHVVRENCAFLNKANGLYANHEIVSPFFYNNTSFNNGTDVDMLGLDGTTTTSVGVLRNNLAYSPNGHGLLADMTNGGPISDEFNSWDTGLLPEAISATDFMSVTFTPPASCPQAYTPGGTACCLPTDMTCFAGMASARQPDGSLPVLPFLRPSATSQLIGKGTDVGLPFSGTAPTLGCFDPTLPFDQGDGGVSGVSGSTTGTSGTTTGTSGTGTTGATGTGTTGTAGAAGTAGATGSAGAAGTSGTGSTTGTGATSGTASTGTGTASGSSATGAGGSSGQGVLSDASTGTGGAASGSNGEQGTGGGQSSPGCGCRVGAGGGGGSGSGRLLLLAFGLIAVAGRRTIRARGGARSLRS